MSAVRSAGPLSAFQGVRSFSSFLFGKALAIAYAVPQRFGFIDAARDGARQTIGGEVAQAHRFALARFRHGDLDVLELGNLDAARDFTDVRDVVRAYALLLERGLIALLAQHPIGEPSRGWLGRDAVSPVIANTGLWNTQQVTAAPITPMEFNVLNTLVENETTR